MRAKIYYNIEDSTFYSDFHQFRFYFSSEYYQKKFAFNVESYLHNEYSKLKYKYLINENQVETETLKLILVLNYYKRLEKRGFRVYFNSNYRKGEATWEKIDK